MKTIADSRLRSIGVVAVIAAAVALGLSGCVPGSTPTNSPSPSASGTSSASPTATPSGSATPSPSTAAATPTKIPCGTLVSAQVVYDFNPNFGLDGGFSPKAGTAAATAVSDQGTACNWLNQTSGDTFTISAARPAASDLATLAAKAASGTAVSGLGDSAWFSSNGGVGRVDVFTGAYWLAATSVYFGSATDANSLVTAALGALK